MNPDQLIQSAYEDTIKRLYATLFDNYAQSGGEQAQQRRADQAFTTGVGFAQKSRDRAVALLAGSA